MRVIVAYDISSDRRRAHAAAALATHGVRIQRSVFEIIVDDGELSAVVDQLNSLINAEVDVFHVIPICATCQTKRRTGGQAWSPLDESVWVV